MPGWRRSGDVAGHSERRRGIAIVPVEGLRAGIQNGGVVLHERHERHTEHPSQTAEDSSRNELIERGTALRDSGVPSGRSPLSFGSWGEASAR
jgi:hypothetical protein